jgi:UDP-N-acetyl-L-fucosamine synthase
MKTIMTVIGTRPEIIRLSEFIKRADKLNGVKHILVHTGQNYDYELNEIFFEDLGLRKPDYFLDAVGNSPTVTIGNILIKMDDLLTKVRPDIFYVLGDTNSALSAIAAKKHKIPVFHSEAGNRSFDNRVPEEFNRRLIDHIADINLPYSQIARQNLLSEGIHSSRIFVTGSPIKEVFQANIEKINTSKILSTLKIKPKKYIVISAHREENVSDDGELSKLFETLNKLAERYLFPIIVSTHPRLNNVISEKKFEVSELVRFIKPLSFSDYIFLQQNSFCVLSDSGTISEETSIIGFHALNIRYSQERYESLEAGILPLVGLDSDTIIRSIDYVINRTLEGNNVYQETDFSNRIINLLLSTLLQPIEL